jgi:DNA-directed RNA polymerase subunit RPC12/RpoP
MTDETSATVEHICPNCEFFYLHGKSEWEDHPKCTDCSHRGGMVDNWKERAQGGA